MHSVLLGSCSRIARVLLSEADKFQCTLCFWGLAHLKMVNLRGSEFVSMHSVLLGSCSLRSIPATLRHCFFLYKFVRFRTAPFFQTHFCKKLLFAYAIYCENNHAEPCSPIIQIKSNINLKKNWYDNFLTKLCTMLHPANLIFTKFNSLLALCVSPWKGMEIHLNLSRVTKSHHANLNSFI